MGNGLENICHFKDARGLYPISLTAMYCQEAALIQRIIDENPRAIEERTGGKPFERTPYEHMIDHLNDEQRGGWDNGQKFQMLGLLDYEDNTSRWETPPVEEVSTEVNDVPGDNVSPDESPDEEETADPEQSPELQ
mmetsp:Transcript_11494/g.12803  ORF Transcript_11494/g.12803 Transcript_11494/m.12803 type:complete len:136 (+) Transcript_11494:408-815(+)